MPHVGHTTTQAVESSHSAIKKYLISSKADLKSVFGRLTLFWQQQRGTLDIVHAQDTNKISVDLNHNIFSWIRGQVSPFALQLLAKEISALPANNASLTSFCACTIKATHGLLCHHILYQHLTGNAPITVAQIHKHWWLWRPQEQPQGGDEFVKVATKPDVPLDPLQVKGKGRPTGAIATTSSTSNKARGIMSTKRLPSAFEYGLQDELATAKPASTAPAALGSEQKQQTTKPVVKLAIHQPIKQAPKKLTKRAKEVEEAGDVQTQTSTKDCFVAAVTSGLAVATANPEVTSTMLGLQRLEQAGKDDLYEPGTAAPRACNRFFDALDTIDPYVEDGYDEALEAAEAAAREDLEDAAILTGS